MKQYHVHSLDRGPLGSLTIFHLSTVNGIPKLSGSGRLHHREAQSFKQWLNDVPRPWSAANLYVYFMYVLTLYFVTVYSGEWHLCISLGIYVYICTSSCSIYRAIFNTCIQIYIIHTYRHMYTLTYHIHVHVHMYIYVATGKIKGLHNSGWWMTVVYDIQK